MRRELEDLLFNTPKDDVTPVDDKRSDQLYMEYTQFRLHALKEKEKNTYRYRKLKDRSTTPLEWWLTEGVDYPALKGIAVKLFSLAASSAASERNFSTMGFIHSKRRNRLGLDTVEKLVFVKCNIGAFYKSPAIKDDSYNSENDSDDSDSDDNDD